MTGTAARKIILASGSQSRWQMLAAAGLVFEAVPSRVDERAIRDALEGDSGAVDPMDLAEILARAKAEDVSRDYPCLRVIDLSRNFGKEAALMAGLDAATGKAVIPIDADLQHPPELIPTLIQRWQQGYDVVLCRRSSRSTGTARSTGHLSTSGSPKRTSTP